MSDPKYDESRAAAILEDLKRAGENMTAEDERKQAVSWIMGCQDKDSNMTREEAEECVNRMYGCKKE